MTRVLVNSLPKSGTHLLMKAIELFGYQEHFDDPHAPSATPIFLNYREAKNAVEKLDAESIKPHRFSKPVRFGEETIPIGTLVPFQVASPLVKTWLEVMPIGRYILGHITYTPHLGPLLTELNYHHVAIIRDPRAVVASLLDFILDTRGMPKPHFLEADFKGMTTAERLDLLLQGGYAPQAQATVNSFLEVYRAMLAWQNDPRCLLVRFEALVGAQGGGSDEAQQAVLTQIAQHLGHPPLSSLNQGGSVYSSNSRTFRKGQIDSWKETLDATSLDYLTRYCEPLCREAGYDLH